MYFPVADQRILQANAATLSVVMTNQDGTATDAAGAVTVGVTTADGTVVVAPGTAATHGFNGSGVYSVDLAANKTAALGLLIATWTDAGDGSVTTTLVEIVGRYYFSIAELRSSDTTLVDASKYSNADVLSARAEVEAECERICDVAFVPRYRRATLAGSGTSELVLPDNRIRTVRSVRIISDLSAGTRRTLTTTELGDIAVTEDNRIVRTDGAVFDEGVANIVVEYEHGWDRPHADLRKATMRRARELLNASRLARSDRARKTTDADGATEELAPPSEYSTGNPTIDAVYSRFSMRAHGGAGGDGGQAPASRRVDFDPQYHSLWNGGRR